MNISPDKIKPLVLPELSEQKEMYCEDVLQYGSTRFSTMAARILMESVIEVYTNRPTLYLCDDEIYTNQGIIAEMRDLTSNSD